MDYFDSLHNDILKEYKKNRKNKNIKIYYLTYRLNMFEILHNLVII
jgi:hypothetical protein